MRSREHTILLEGLNQTFIISAPHPIRYLITLCPWIADLSSLFNWNTKQLFVYLEAEYTNAKGVSPHHVPCISYGLCWGVGDRFRILLDMLEPQTNRLRVRPTGWGGDTWLFQFRDVVHVMVTGTA